MEGERKRVLEGFSYGEPPIYKQKKPNPKTFVRKLLKKGSGVDLNKDSILTFNLKAAPDELIRYNLKSFYGKK